MTASCERFPPGNPANEGLVCPNNDPLVERILTRIFENVPREILDKKNEKKPCCLRLPTDNACHPVAIPGDPGAARGA